MEASQKLASSNLKLVLNRHGEKVWVPKNVSPDQLLEIQGLNHRLPYSPLVADLICTQVAEGKTLVDISRQQGMPTYAEIARWRRDFPEFNDAYKFARADRAEVYFHKMILEVEQAKADKDEVALARLKTDIYKFAAKVCAPDEYAEKTTLDAKVAVGTFSIETGIRRVDDAGFNKDETAALIEQGVIDVEV